MNKENCRQLHHDIWLSWERHHVFSKSCTNSTDQMALPPVDQPQAPDTVEKLLQAYKVESCQQQRRFSSCKHLSLVSLVNSSTGQSSGIYTTTCLFLSFQFSLIVELLFSNMHPSITIYFKFNSPIHTFLCIILLVVSRNAPTLMRKSKVIAYSVSSDNIEGK